MDLNRISFSDTCKWVKNRLFYVTKGAKSIGPKIPVCIFGNFLGGKKRQVPKFPEFTALRGRAKISEISYGNFRSIWLSSQHFKNFRLNGSLFGNFTISGFSGNVSTGNFRTFASFCPMFLQGLVIIARSRWRVQAWTKSRLIRHSLFLSLRNLQMTSKAEKKWNKLKKNPEAIYSTWETGWPHG